MKPLPPGYWEKKKEKYLENAREGNRKRVIKRGGKMRPDMWGHPSLKGRPKGSVGDGDWDGSWLGDDCIYF